MIFFPFRGLRKTAEFDYEHSEIYHYVFTARLAFIVVFEVLHQKNVFFHRVQIFKLNIFQHFILFLKIAIAYIIPDVPTNLSVQLDRERQTEQENQYKDQQKKLREKRESLNSSDTIIGKEWSKKKKSVFPSEVKLWYSFT